MESLQQAPRAIVVTGKKSIEAKDLAPEVAARKRQIRESISWSLCFGLVAVLTGGLLFYQVGVTMSSVSTWLFYGSLGGFLFFAGRAIFLFGNRPSASGDQPVHLN